MPILNAVLPEHGVRILKNTAIGDLFQFGLHGFYIVIYQKAVREQEERRSAEDEIDHPKIELQACDQVDSIFTLHRYCSAAVRLEPSFDVLISQIIDMFSRHY